MENGNIVEYIDHQKIICAVVLEVKNSRLRLLTENNREINLSASRIAHQSNSRLDSLMGRDRLVDTLREKARQREKLTRQINIKELWEVLNTEQEWIDLETMTDLCFPNQQDGDHESAVVRAFFKNRFYFKFRTDAFFPHTEAQVERLFAQTKEEEHRNLLIKTGGKWIKEILESGWEPSMSDIGETGQTELIEIIKSYYLFQKDSPYAALAKAMINIAGIEDPDALFEILVAIGVLSRDENLDVLKMDVPVEFSPEVLQNAQQLMQISESDDLFKADRRDLTTLSMITIDGQSTLDFDDALSIEKYGQNYRLGVHIADVAYYIDKYSVLDQEALARGSSIYMPDLKIPMFPSILAEDLCSLKESMVRPAISLMIHITPSADVLEYEFFPSLIRVSRQLSYFEANLLTETDPEIASLYHLAQEFQKCRMDQGALQINLPEINIWIAEDGSPVVTRTNRESPGRMLVAELMILANWLMARFLDKQGIPTVFRTQPAPKERLFKGMEGSLFQNWMQRKLLSRFILNTKADHHSGLGLNAYTTGTSPIRKYLDLVTQRQLRAALGLETPYPEEVVSTIIQNLQQPMSQVARLQFRRNRYWLLRYLEGQIGRKEEAIVLQKRRNAYQILLTEFMIECVLPVSGSVNLKPEDLVQVTIQHVNARKDIISVYLG